jgi:cation:H+ antiporter
MNADVSVMTRDLTFFIAIYGIAIASTFIGDRPSLKIIVGIGLVVGYGIYLRTTASSSCDEMEDVADLYFGRMLHFGSTKALSGLQILVSLAALVAGARLFIVNVESISAMLGVAPLILSIIITPIATELPEKVNSVIWVGRKKDTLALGNITGAMVFQSSFPVAFGVVFTPWALAGVTLVSAVLALSSSLLALIWVRVFKKINPYILLAGGAFYSLLFVYILGHG